MRNPAWDSMRNSVIHLREKARSSPDILEGRLGEIAENPWEKSLEAMSEILRETDAGRASRKKVYRNLN